MAFDNAEPDLPQVQPRAPGLGEVDHESSDPRRARPFTVRVSGGGAVVHDQLQTRPRGMREPRCLTETRNQELLELVRCLHSPVAISGAANRFAVPFRTVVLRCTARHARVASPAPSGSGLTPGSRFSSTRRTADTVKFSTDPELEARLAGGGVNAEVNAAVRSLSRGRARSGTSVSPGAPW